MDCATPDWLAHLSVGNLQVAAISISFNAPAAPKMGCFQFHFSHTGSDWQSLQCSFFPSSAISSRLHRRRATRPDARRMPPVEMQGWPHPAPLLAMPPAAASPLAT